MCRQGLLEKGGVLAEAAVLQFGVSGGGRLADASSQSCLQYCSRNLDALIPGRASNEAQGIIKPAIQL